MYIFRIPAFTGLRAYFLSLSKCAAIWHGPHHSFQAVSVACGVKTPPRQFDTIQSRHDPVFTLPLSTLLLPSSICYRRHQRGLQSPAPRRWLNSTHLSIVELRPCRPYGVGWSRGETGSRRQIVRRPTRR